MKGRTPLRHSQADVTMDSPIDPGGLAESFLAAQD